MDQRENPYASPLSPPEAPEATPKRRRFDWLTLLEVAVGIVLGAGGAVAVVRLMQWLNT